MSTRFGPFGISIPKGWRVEHNYAGQSWDLFDGVNVALNLSTIEVSRRLFCHYREQEKANGQYRQAGQTSRDTTAAQPAAGDAGGTAPDLTSSYTSATNSYTSAAQAASQTGLGMQPGGAVYTNQVSVSQLAAYQAQVLAAYRTSQMLVPTVAAPPQIIELPRAAPAVGELVGYRCWRNYGGTLLSVTASTPWPPHCPMRDTTASGAKISDFGGTGVWAFRSPFRCGAQFQLGSGHYVYGSIWMWGTVIEHEDGYRAEYAAIRSLDDADAEINLERLRDRYLKK